MTINGEPAFPVNELNQRSGNIFANHLGMSLRDYFAAAFMHSHVQMNAHNINDHQARTAARFAYMVADAMLTERTKGNSQ
jgi:hypothetical protein